VDRGVDHDQIGPSAGEALLAALAAVGAAVVDHPEHPGGGAVGFPRHHLANEPREGSDAGLAFTAAEDSGLMDVPGGQIGPGSLAHVFVLDTHRAAGLWSGTAVSASAGLNAGLLVGADDEIVPPQWPPLPDAFVEVEDSAGLVGEEGVPGEDPAAMRPGADCVLGKPAPDGGFPDRGHQPAADRLPPDLAHAEAREGEAQLAGQLTGEGLYGDDDTGGERHPASPAGGVPPGRPFPAGRSACATC
jgi:hypothetical protein